MVQSETLDNWNVNIAPPSTAVFSGWGETRDEFTGSACCKRRDQAKGREGSNAGPRLSESESTDVICAYGFPGLWETYVLTRRDWQAERLISGTRNSATLAVIVSPPTDIIIDNWAKSCTECLEIMNAICRMFAIHVSSASKKRDLFLGGRRGIIQIVLHVHYP